MKLNRDEKNYHKIEKETIKKTNKLKGLANGAWIVYPPEGGPTIR